MGEPVNRHQPPSKRPLSVAWDRYTKMPTRSVDSMPDPTPRRLMPKRVLISLPYLGPGSCSQDPPISYSHVTTVRYSLSASPPSLRPRLSSSSWVPGPRPMSRHQRGVVHSETPRSFFINPKAVGVQKPLNGSSEPTDAQCSPYLIPSSLFAYTCIRSSLASPQVSWEERKIPINHDQVGRIRL